MANLLFQTLRRIRASSLSSLLSNFSSPISHSFRSVSRLPQSIPSQFEPPNPFIPSKPKWGFRDFSYGSVSLVFSEGKPKFETRETEPTRKDKCKAKRLFNIYQARIKEAMLVERLKKYEVSKLQGPVVEPVNLTGEERFYMKKMAQKKSNYVPVGRRGVFAGVILNMHLHWKKHETVKVICKPCKPGQVHEYAEDIARLSGGTPIQIIGNDTIIFYRGKDYVRPKVMSPIDTLSKKKALEKSKYEQSLETVRRFIAIAEKELELYYRHIALYGDPTTRNSYPSFTDNDECDSDDSGEEDQKRETTKESIESIDDFLASDLSELDDDSDGEQLSRTEIVGDSEGSA
ncbi:hypothetical protein QJS04_geneDACA015525 [Acorus gramineus]|uniref:CRM domain-containing protein n=1 Tax=Acorus gramineus TaxID=55184 RepID=A0AAV9AU17_ACOGR|nr:hypothetical protein QJS04_geneDACA015525 [Acorus gramineus]